MNRKLHIPFILISLFLCFGCSNHKNEDNILVARDNYEKFVSNHEFSKAPVLNKKQLEQIPKYDRPDLAWQQDFLRTMDPVTGKPERERLLPTIEFINNDIRENRFGPSDEWEERGPYQVGGRTRAIMFDPNDVSAKKVWAAGVNGGIWFNNDITTASSEWTQVFTTLDNFAVCAMDYDPIDLQTFYAGTGEGLNNSDAARGAGMWKSIDGGDTWTLLNSTSGFDYILDIEIRDEGGSEGVIYIATRNPGGIYRSTDGGTSFTQVYASSTNDLEIGVLDNRIWAGTFNGKVIYSDNGTTWTDSYVNTDPSGDRVEVGLAPTDANYVYAIIESGNAVDDIVYTPNALFWNSISEPDDSTDGTVPSNDFSRGQAWYDLILTVRPNNKDEFYVGGVNSFKGTLAANTATYSKISSWELLVDNSVSYSHADQHNFIFRPGFPDEALMATDGGVFYIPDVSNLENITNGIVQMNKGFNITQFYSCALHPDSGSNTFLGGTQDNGTLEFDSAGIDDTTEKSGGDGGFCFIDQTFPGYKITSFTNNNYIIFDDSNGTSQDLLSTGGGSFINPADYDDNLNILYTNGGSNINRVKLRAFPAEGGTLNPSNVGFSPDGLSGTPTHLRVSPYTTLTSTLFVGTSNGNVYKIENADDEGSTPVANNISAGISTTGSVSCIEIGSNEDELLVTYSNYGVTSVWYTSDGGTNWTNKEGNLPDMPIRWALFNPDNREQVILATELGIWGTTQISNTTTTWNPENTGMGNVRVDMFQYRSSDKTILAATHGRGMFTSSFANVLSTNDFRLDKSYSVFPNPVKQSELLNIRFDKNYGSEFDVVIFDISGKEVLSKNNIQTSNKLSLDLSGLNKGMFILEIRSENNSITQKIIIN